MTKDGTETEKNENFDKEKKSSQTELYLCIDPVLEEENSIDLVAYFNITFSNYQIETNVNNSITKNGDSKENNDISLLSLLSVESQGHFSIEQFQNALTIGSNTATTLFSFYQDLMKQK